MGERVIVGLNADSSVKELKGPSRPVNDQQSRATLLAATQFVDAVVIFYENTPSNIIHTIKPDVLVKGGDWKKDEIIFVLMLKESIKYDQVKELALPEENDEHIIKDEIIKLTGEQTKTHYPENLRRVAI